MINNEKFIKRERGLRLYLYMKNKPYRDLKLAIENLRKAIIGSFLK